MDIPDFDLSLPMVKSDAQKAMWFDTGYCMTDMGRHFVGTGMPQTGMLLTMYKEHSETMTGLLINGGPTVGTGAVVQNSPPFENFLDFQAFSLHVYFSDHLGACI